MPLRIATVLLLAAALALSAGCRQGSGGEAGKGATALSATAATRELTEAQGRARRNPDDSAAQMAAARLALKYAAYNDAYRAYRRAVELGPDNYEALVGLAEVNLRLQNPTEGLDWLSRARRLKPQDAALTELEARLLLTGGDFGRAAAAFERAVKLAPKRSVTRLNLASAYALLNRRAEAVAAAREAVRLDPGSTAASFALGRHLQRAGDSAGAEQAYRQSLRLDPHNAPAMIALARLLMEQGHRLEEARQLAIEASQIRTDRADAAIIAAWVLHRQGDDQGAANELIKLVDSNPQNPEAWAKLEVCLRALGKTKEAKQAADMARRFVAESPSASELKQIEGGQ